VDAEEVLGEQRRYYEDRAPEYDDWFLRRGRYDRGPAETQRWRHDLEEVTRVFDGVDWRGRRVLEMAPGTGWWTERLLDAGASRVTALDASPAMLAQLARRLGARADRVDPVVGDLFDYVAGDRFDAVLFGFWLSHVPRARLQRFFQSAADSLDDHGAIFFVDSRRVESSTASDHVLPETSSEVMVRRLDDGREYRIVKNFYEPEEIEEVAAGVGLDLEVSTTSTYFIVGSGEKVR